MAKIMTMEDNCEKIAKILLKEFKSLDANKSVRRIGISSKFQDRAVKDKNGYHYETVFEYRGKDGEVKSISFGKEISEDSYDFSRITNLIKGHLMDKMKLKNDEVRFINTDTVYGVGSWYSRPEYTICNGIEVVRPCKEFISANKKLTKLGLNAIPLKSWNVDYVSGKRSHIFDHDVHYRGVDSKVCSKLLDFLKGKKKLSYEIKEQKNLEGMEYGERYETEWDGSIDHYLSFKDAKGRVVFNLF